MELVVRGFTSLLVVSTFFELHFPLLKGEKMGAQ